MSKEQEKTALDRVQAIRPGVLTAVALAIGAAIVLAQPGTATFMSRTLFNAGHAPLFAILTLICWTMMRRTKLCYRPALCYQATFGIMFVLAFLTELAQIPVGRDAEMMDVDRDILGVIAALLIIRSFNPRWRQPSAGTASRQPLSLPRGAVWFLRVLAILLIALPFYPVAQWSAAYGTRDANFPELVNFARPIGYQFLKPENANFVVTPAPEAWPDMRDRQVGRITFLPTTFPQIYIDELHPDWTGYSNLEVKLFNPVDTAVQIVIRIHDKKHNQEVTDRYNERFMVEPGPNRLEIPLERIRTAPASRPMDMTALRTLVLFAHAVPDTFSLYLGELRLR